MSEGKFGKQPGPAKHYLYQLIWDETTQIINFDCPFFGILSTEIRLVKFNRMVTAIGRGFDLHESKHCPKRLLFVARSVVPIPFRPSGRIQILIGHMDEIGKLVYIGKLVVTLDGTILIRIRRLANLEVTMVAPFAISWL